MKSVFIESTIFSKLRAQYLNDDEFRLLQAELMLFPEHGMMIQGTGGLRKIRVANKGRGKRRSIRVIYYYRDSNSHFYLLTLYCKSEVADLTRQQKQQLKQFMMEWCHE